MNVKPCDNQTVTFFWSTRCALHVWANFSSSAFRVLAWGRSSGFLHSIDLMIFHCKKQQKQIFWQTTMTVMSLQYHWSSLYSVYNICTSDNGCNRATPVCPPATLTSWGKVVENSLGNLWCLASSKTCYPCSDRRMNEHVSLKCVRS